MAKKSSKATVTAQSPTAPEVLSPPQEAAGAPNLGKAVDDVLAEISKVQAQRAGLAGLLAVVEKQKAKLREAEASYQAAASVVDQLQADLITKYPAAAGVFGGVKAPKRGGAKKGPRSGVAKKGGPVLDKAQAEQVLAALPSTFQLADFKTKTAEFFPDRIGKGAMELLADKVKDAGGKGMGRRYKKN
jgi:hypothetical protein